MARGAFKNEQTCLPGVQAIMAESDHHFARHTHDQYGVGVVLAGGQRSASGRGQVEARSGDLITVNPNEVHDGAPLGRSPRAWRMLYFDPGVILGETDSLSGGGQEMKFPVLPEPILAQTFGALYRAATTLRPIARLAAEGLLLTLLPSLLAEKPALRPIASSAIRHAIATIDDAPAEDVSLQQLADSTGLSRFQVLRAFQKATGMPPHAYLLQRRLDLARRLMRQGLELADVAAAAGFSDQSHMTRCFAARYGLTPGSYVGACE